MNRAGVTLIEVTIVGIIAVALISIIFGLFNTTDRAYRSELPLRERQIQCQASLDAISRDVQESSGRVLWSVGVAAETLPSGVQAPRALVFLSARDASGRFVTDGMTLQPIWQKAIAYIPLNVLNASGAPDGTVALYRFDFGPGSVPANLGDLIPQITAGTQDITLEWRPAAGGAAANPPGQIAAGRTARGVVTLPGIARFSLSNPMLTAGTEDDLRLADGQTWAADVWNVGVTVNLKLSDGRNHPVRVDATIQGRN